MRGRQFDAPREGALFISVVEIDDTQPGKGSACGEGSCGRGCCAWRAATSFDAQYAQLQQRAWNVLEQRGIATPMQHADLYGSLIQVRRCDEARALFARHPDELSPMRAMEATVSA
jgi:hypothetical protein